MKKCWKCNQEEPKVSFSKNKRKPDGLSTECKDCVKKYNASYRNTNKAYFKEYLAEYQKENGKELYEKKKQYIAENKEAHWDRQHAWYEKNKEVIQARVACYKKEHPEQYQMYANRRIAAKKTDIVENFSINDIAIMYGDKCFYCAAAFEHIDHFVPLSKGGEHTLENVRPSCQACNLRKSNKMPGEFIKGIL